MDGAYHAARQDSRIEQLRVPPQSIEAEQAVLGGLMLAPDSLVQVADLLVAEDFYRRDHQLIYRAIGELAAKEKPYDAVTLAEWFESQGLGEQVAGGSYLVMLATTTPSAANIKAYADIVRDKAVLRELIEVGTGIVNDGFQPEGRESTEILADATAAVSKIAHRTAMDGGLRMVRSSIRACFDEIVARDAGTVDVGLTPPWGNLRRKLPGLENEDFMVLAARPSMGKTVAGMEWADHAASLGRNVAVFSMEMSSKQLTLRLTARRARVDMARMRERGALTDADWSAITAAQRELYELPLAIDDAGTLTMEALRARACRMHAKVPGGLGLIVVDYLQLMSGSGSDGKRYEEITKISRGLKLLAKELHAPVIALSQLNRSVETRPDKRPVMSDLRESGAIEQDADVVVMIYRDDYYTKDACSAPGIAEMIIGKQRNGPTGTVYLRHHLECSYFSDYHGAPPRYGKQKATASRDGFDDDELPLGGKAAAVGSDR